MRSFLAVLLFAAPAQAQVVIDWVTVGNPGNTCKVQAEGCFGSVAANYQLAQVAVTNAQYAVFLNAVAQADPNGLYDPHMADPVVPPYGGGGITRSGGSGNYLYATIAGRANMPVNYVTFWDALRFANWLHNGQPSGAQGPATTEDGAYTLTPEGIAANSIIRNPGALAYVPSEDEWYKAAYYKFGGINAGYWDYPVRQNNSTACTAPSAPTNRANCGSAVGDLSISGAYPGSFSASGTFDQGGNVWEWNQTPINVVSRGVRGGGFASLQVLLGAAVRGSGSPAEAGVSLGFRVARPVPVFTKLAAPLPVNVPAVGPLGLLVVAGGLLAAARLLRARRI